MLGQEEGLLKSEWNYADRQLGFLRLKWVTKVQSMGLENQEPQIKNSKYLANKIENNVRVLGPRLE